MANMTNPLSGDNNCTVILNDLPSDLTEKLSRLAAERGMSTGEVAEGLITRHLETDGDR